MHTFLIHDFKFGGVALAEEVRSVHKGENYTLVVILSSGTARIEDVSFENSSLQFNWMLTRTSATNWVLNLNITDADTFAMKTISTRVSYALEGSNFTASESETSKIEVFLGPPMPSAPLELILYQIALPEFQDMPVIVRGTIEQIKKEQNTGHYKITISDGISRAKITSTAGNFAAGDRVKVTGEIRFEGEIYSSNINKILQLNIDAPIVPEQGKEYKITIRAEGRPVEGVSVTVGDSIYLTDSNGVVYHKFNTSGSLNIEARKEDYLPARAVVVVERQSPGLEFILPAISLLIAYACYQRKLLKR